MDNSCVCLTLLLITERIKWDKNIRYDINKQDFPNFYYSILSCVPVKNVKIIYHFLQTQKNSNKNELSLGAELLKIAWTFPNDHQKNEVLKIQPR